MSISLLLMTLRAARHLPSRMRGEELMPSAVADLRLQRMRVGEHDHEQLAEQLGDLRVVGAG